MFKKTIHKVIETSTSEFDTDIRVTVYRKEEDARKHYISTVENIESEAEDRFSEFGTDDDQCVGVRDYGLNYFGIHEAGRASEWERTVCIEKDTLR